MENKKSFYRNTSEKVLAHAVDSIYNDYVGGEENHYLDHDERYFNFTEDSLIKTITGDLLKQEKYLYLDNGMVLEAKHIRFIGAKRIGEIVEHRVKYRHKKEGWCFENCKKVWKGN